MGQIPGLIQIPQSLQKVVEQERLTLMDLVAMMLKEIQFKMEKLEDQVVVELNLEVVHWVEIQIKIP